MKRLTLALLSVTACVLAIGSAEAADFSRPPPPVYAPLPPPSAWNGAYFGLNAGWVWGQWDRTGLYDFGDATDDTGASKKPNGFLGGAQIGWNKDMGGWVGGIEADINGTNTQTSFSPAGNADTGATSTIDSTWRATIRARLGMAMGPSLWYITGGVAAGDVREISNDDGTVLPRVSATKWGWTAGAGIEQKLAAHVSVKIEYLYIDLGSATLDLGSPIGDPDQYVTSIRVHDHVVRAGINYSFD